MPLYRARLPRGRFLTAGTARHAIAARIPSAVIAASVSWIPTASLTGPATITPSGIMPALAA